LASAYVNHVGEEPSKVLPANLASPLRQVCALLNRPPILSYDAYALYNWKRFRSDQPVALGNIDTVQNFVHLYDEHWFVLVHVEIEAIAARLLDAIARIHESLASNDEAAIDRAVGEIADAINDQVRVLKRIPEKMDPTLYYKTFRPYIRFFEDVEYEVEPAASSAEILRMNFRGETGAQSSIMPTLVALMKIPHAPSMLTNHLADMRNYMPAAHRHLIEADTPLPTLPRLVSSENDNAVPEPICDLI